MPEVVRAVIRTSSPYERCHELFDTYPLAVRAANDAKTIRLMILMLRDGDNGKFFVLSHDRSSDRNRYSLRSWRTAGTENIEAEPGTVSDLTASVITDGVPVPQDEFLFGWRDSNVLTALVVIYTTYSPVHQEPSWAVMPLAGSPEAQWPPFTRERLLGHWFWEHYWAGNVVSVGGLIASTSDTVFWVDTEAILGSDCCAVAREVRSVDELALPEGRYVYHEVLSEGDLVPPLDGLLAYPGKADLASRFRPYSAEHGDLQTGELS
jgi:hypothetical protein